MIDWSESAYISTRHFDLHVGEKATFLDYENKFLLVCRMILFGTVIVRSKVADKILRHVLFLDFLHERQLIADIQIVISIALEMRYKLKKEKNK